MGNIYVADSNNHRIQMFLANQSNDTTIAGVTDVLGTNSTHLKIPYWLTLDNQLNLYVSDTFNHRVQKFLRYQKKHEQIETDIAKLYSMIAFHEVKIRTK